MIDTHFLPSQEWKCKGWYIPSHCLEVFLKKINLCNDRMTTCILYTKDIRFSLLILHSMEVPKVISTGILNSKSLWRHWNMLHMQPMQWQNDNMHSIYEGYKVFAPYTSFNGSTKSYFYGCSKLEILLKRSVLAHNFCDEF